MTEELVLSSSSVAAYQDCEYRWYLQYIEMQPGVQSIQSAVGSAVHAGAEHFYREMLSPTSNDPIDVAALEVADLSFMLELADVVDAAEDPLKMRPVVARVLTSYLEDVGTKIASAVLSVEQGVRINVGGIPFSGHPDVMQDGIVRDTKVLGSRPRYPRKYLFQMTGSALIYEVEFGELPADRIVDVMIRLKRDRPRHEPISYGETTRAEMRDFVRQLEEVANGIARGAYPPTGLSTGACKYCPVRYVCDPYLNQGG